jgi:hypothetical protein
MRGALVISVAMVGACIRIPEFRGGDDAGSDNEAAIDAITTPCQQAIALPGLLVYMPLDSIAAGVTPDASGNNHSGTVLGGAALGPGHHGMGMVLDGGTKAVTLGSPAAFDNLNELTVCAWVNPSTIDPQNAGATIADKSNDGYNGGWNAYLDYEPTSLHVGYLSREGAYGFGASTVPVATWTHACTVWSSTGLTVYVDARVDVIVSMGRTHELPAHDDSANELVLGRQTNSNLFHLNGTLDDFVLYNRALDAAEVAVIQACSP